MFFLGVFLFLAGVMALLVALRKEVAFCLREAGSRLAVLKKMREDISRQKHLLEEELAALYFSMSKTVKMYEVARDVVTTLDETELMDRFSADLKRLMSFEDCRLLPPESPGALGVVAPDVVFPLADKETHFGFLLLKGIASGEHPYLGILVRHFALALKRARLYKTVQELAITDSLTGLYTRRYATERLKEECARSLAHGAPLSFLMIDVDNFKRCNDTFGHLVGDIVLVEIARRIRESIRELDLLARFGGEEFMVFAPNTSKEGALAVAERIRESMTRSEICAYDEKLIVTVSIGLAGCPGDALTPEDLLRKADQALYQAKKTGKDRVVVSGKFSPDA
jgi:diguanylate cyclase (GGDEF)-like protein